MRTNIDIDDELLEQASEVLGTRTKRDTVNAALREVCARQERVGLLALRGQVRWEGDLDESRQSRIPQQ